jgi:hypothetical protein
MKLRKTSAGILRNESEIKSLDQIRDTQRVLPAEIKKTMLRAKWSTAREN